MEAEVQSRLPVWAGQSDRAGTKLDEPRTKASVEIPASLDSYHRRQPENLEARIARDDAFGSPQCARRRNFSAAFAS